MGKAVAARRFLDQPIGPSQHDVGVILSRSFSDAISGDAAINHGSMREPLHMQFFIHWTDEVFWRHFR
jgi:hypothetical protein